MGYVDDPLTILPLLDEVDLHLSKDMRAASLGERQVVHVKRVFRAHIAACNAIAAIDAFVLDNTLAVPLVNFHAFLFEVDGKREGLNGLAQFGSTLLQSLELFQTASGRVRRHLQRFFCALVIVPEGARLGFTDLRRLLQSRWPRREHVRLGANRYISID